MPGSDRREVLPTTESTSVAAGEAQVVGALALAKNELQTLRHELEDERRVIAQLRIEIAQATSHDSPTSRSEMKTDLDASAVAAGLEAARRELVELNDAVLLQQVGIYQYHHPLENAAAYKVQLGEIRTRITDSVRTKAAIESSDRFTYNNSLAQDAR